MQTNLKNNINVDTSISLVNEIYHNDLLLNQYITHTNGYFLYELEKFYSPDLHKLISLGNPLVFHYLVDKKLLSKFWSTYFPTIGYNTINVPYKIKYLSNNKYKIYSPAFNHLNFCWQIQNNISHENQIHEKEYLPSKHEEGLLFHDEIEILVLFQKNYQKYKNLFYQNLPIDDNLPFDYGFFIQKRHLIDEFENSSLFCTIELLMAKFYENNPHIDLLDSNFKNSIITTQKFVNNLIPENILISNHPNVQKSLNSKKIDINSLIQQQHNDFELVQKWKNDPIKNFNTFKDSTSGKVAIPEFPHSFNFLSQENSLINSELSSNSNLVFYFHLLYMAPHSIAEHLLNETNFFSTENDTSIEIDTAYSLPNGLIDKIANNNFFFLPSNFKSMSNKPLPINKKIWNILINNLKNYEQNILNYFIFNSYSQESDIILQMGLDISMVQYNLIFNLPESKFHTPNSFFKSFWRGITLYQLFQGTTNCIFSDSDLSVIRTNKLSILSYAPIIQDFYFPDQDNYNKLIDVLKSNFLDNIQLIDKNSNLLNYSLNHKELGFLSLYQPFDYLYSLQDILNKSEDEIPYVSEIFSSTGISNKYFIKFFTIHLFLTNLHFNILNRYTIFDYNKIQNALRHITFDETDLNEHQKILNSSTFNLQLFNHTKLPNLDKQFVSFNTQILNQLPLKISSLLTISDMEVKTNANISSIENSIIQELVFLSFIEKYYTIFQNLHESNFLPENFSLSHLLLLDVENIFSTNQKFFIKENNTSYLTTLNEIKSSRVNFLDSLKRIHSLKILTENTKKVDKNRMKI